MLKRLIILLLSLLVGGALGYLAAYMLFSGWFSAWQPIASPPETTSKLLALSKASLWVEAVSGQIYYNPAAPDCLVDCWSQVAEVPADLPLAPDTLERFAQTCVTPPPFFGIVDSQAECQRGMWQDDNTAYVLRGDGQLFVWRYRSGGEWTALGFILFIGFGAVGLFAITLGLVLFQAGLAWLSRRA